MSNKKRTTLCSILAGLLLWLPAAVIAAPVNDTFDHFTTGFSLTGGHRAVECDACHNAGQFRGTPRECASCHNLLTNTGAVIKDSAHIQANNACDVCHSTLAWDDVRRVNHMAVLGRCVSCHNNITVAGVPASGHVTVPPGSDCIDCHRTSTWASTHYNHGANAAGRVCSECHNGVDATGKSGSHIGTTGFECDDCHTTHKWGFNHNTVTNSNCESCHGDGTNIASRKSAGHIGTTGLTCSDCHNTRSWTFNHVDAQGDCLQCHGDGTNIATRKGAGHPVTTETCSLCHTTRNWNFTHSAVTGACSGCHNGTTATGLPGGHVDITGLECNACHTTRAWTPASYGHTDPNYPPDHGWESDCGRCHSGSPQTAGNVNVYDYSSRVRECIDCHYQDFRKEHRDSKLPEYNNCLSGCHEHSMRKF